jgi:peptide/nickel transport system permease protein
MRTRQVFAKKVGALAITILAVYTLNFVLFHMLPGDPAYALVGARIPKEQAEELKERLGLNEPLYVQYFHSVTLLVQGELGWSWFYKKDVTDVVLDRMKYTLLLVGVGTFLAIVIGTNLGIIAGSRRGTIADISIVGSSLAFYAMPAFWLGMIMLMIFSVEYGIFPLRGFVEYTGTDQSLIDKAADALWHMVLPVTVFVLVSISEFVLMMRNALVDVLTEDYITTARAKGLRQRDIIRKHGVPNAMIPTVATIAMFIGWVVTGTIMIEVVFSWPGVGSLTWDAIKQQDYPLLQGIFLIITVTMILANFVADIIYLYIDPRVRI